MSNSKFRSLMVSVMNRGVDPYNSHDAVAKRFEKRWKDEVRREQIRAAKRAGIVDIKVK